MNFVARPATMAVLRPQTLSTHFNSILRSNQTLIRTPAHSALPPSSKVRIRSSSRSVMGTKIWDGLPEADSRRSNTTNTHRLVLTTPAFSPTNAVYMICSYPTSFERSFKRGLLRHYRLFQVSIAYNSVVVTYTDGNPDSQLPAHIETYHSLVPLDTKHQKSSTIFGGYSSWIYKAQSSTNGSFVALRRLEGELALFGV